MRAILLLVRALDYHGLMWRYESLPARSLCALSHSALSSFLLHRLLRSLPPLQVRVLIDAGADVNKAKRGGSTPVLTASHYGDVGCIKLLVERGADVNKCMDTGTTPIHIASQSGFSDAVKVRRERRETHTHPVHCTLGTVHGMVCDAGKRMFVRVCSISLSLTHTHLVSLPPLPPLPPPPPPPSWGGGGPGP